VRQAGDRRPADLPALGKSRDGADKLALLPGLLLPVYQQLLDALAGAGVEWVQIDEPILALDLPPTGSTPSSAPTTTESARVKLLLATYFGRSRTTSYLACQPAGGRPACRCRRGPQD
jgi:5-methyltetrahydropteroyltriglutamate--homocysteine methyltransferase